MSERCRKNDHLAAEICEKHEAGFIVMCDGAFDALRVHLDDQVVALTAEVAKFCEENQNLQANAAEAMKRMLKFANKHAAATQKIGELIIANRTMHRARELSEKRAEALGLLWSRLVDWLHDGMWVMDGGDLQEMAEKAGLLKQVPYDPEQHRDVEGEPGDSIYVLTDLGKATYTTCAKPGPAGFTAGMVCPS